LHLLPALLGQVWLLEDRLARDEACAPVFVPFLWCEVLCEEAYRHLGLIDLLLDLESVQRAVSHLLLRLVVKRDRDLEGPACQVIILNSILLIVGAEVKLRQVEELLSEEIDISLVLSVVQILLDERFTVNGWPRFAHLGPSRAFFSRKNWLQDLILNLQKAVQLRAKALIQIDDRHKVDCTQHVNFSVHLGMVIANVGGVVLPKSEEADNHDTGVKQDADIYH